MATRSIVPRADGEGSLGTAAKRWGTVHAKNILTNDAASHNSLYRGAEITDSWATIKANIQAGNFENYYIGDYKTITLSTNETVVCEIAGINCYKNWGYSGIPNHIDFISLDCLATPYRFNDTATNNGTAQENTPFRASALFNTLTSITDGVITTLPADLRAVIEYKNVYIESRYSPGGTVSADTAIANAYLQLWIPAETEVFDHPTWSEIGYGTSGFLQYPIFRLSPSKIRKGEGNGGSRVSWYTLSAYKGNATDICTVSSQGNANHTAANDTIIRVPLCFRVA